MLIFWAVLGGFLLDALFGDPACLLLYCCWASCSLLFS